MGSLCYRALNPEFNRSAPTAAQSGERKVLWVLWITYGSFYFCRANLSVAVPGIVHDFGFSKAQVGWVLMALKLAYGIGQFVNGQLAERISPRRLLAIGLLASAALNVAFGFATSLYFMIFLWACNGYVQALGWPPTMRVAANWFSRERHGRAIGIIGTGYQLCGALTFFLSGWAAETYGWRGVLFVPAAILVVSAIHMWVMLEDRPAAKVEEKKVEATKPGTSIWENILVTLENPSLWIVAVALWLLDACRYGFSDWGVTHLKEVQGTSVSVAAFKYTVLPLGGIAGTLISGWMTDRFFGARRVPVIVMMLIVLGVLAAAYDTVLHWGLFASTAILFLIGFCIYGSQVLLVGTLPVDLAKRGTAAAAAGFVNFMGYMGAAGGDVLTGQIAEVHGWRTAVMFWSGCAFASAAVIAFIWSKEHHLRTAAKNSVS